MLTWYSEPFLPPLNKGGHVCCPYCDWHRQASRRVLKQYRAHYFEKHR